MCIVSTLLQVITKYIVRSGRWSSGKPIGATSCERLQLGRGFESLRGHVHLPQAQLARDIELDPAPGIGADGLAHWSTRLPGSAPIIRLRARLNEVASWAPSPGNAFKNHPIRAPWVSYYA